MKLKHNLLIYLLIIFQLPMIGFAFEQFEFGDSPDTIKKKYSKSCQFTREYEDTQWLWITKLECTGYKYKGVKTKLLFEFGDKQLVRFHIISIDFENYFFIRNRNNILVSKSGQGFINKIKGYNKPLFNDRVHHYGPNQTLTYFYYKGKWEWANVFEKPLYKKEESAKRQDQLQSYKGNGLKGWANFQFDDSVTKVKENLEGLCSELIIDNKKYLSGKKTMICRDFPFAREKIDLEMVFMDLKFVEAILYLEPNRYKELLPLLKKKYGKPFQEAVETNDHYPFIYFSKHNILMTFQDHAEISQKKQLVLKYSKEGYYDDSKPIPVVIPRKKTNQNLQRKTKEKKKTDVLFDSL